MNIIPHCGLLGMSFFFRFEKLVGGNFIGDLLRKVLLSIVESNALCQGRISSKLTVKDSLGAPDMSAVEYDQGNESAIHLLQKLGYTSSEINSDDIQIVKYVSAVISVRIALLMATCKLQILLLLLTFYNSLCFRFICNHRSYQ